MEPFLGTELSVEFLFTTVPIYMLSLSLLSRCASTTIHQSAAQVCREKVTRISSCISEVHFHSHAAFQRGSRGPLWQLGIPAGVDIKLGPKNRLGSWEQSTGESGRGGRAGGLNAGSGARRFQRPAGDAGAWMEADQWDHCSRSGVLQWKTHGGAAAPL